MSGVLIPVTGVLSVAFAGASGYMAFLAYDERRSRAKRRLAAYGAPARALHLKGAADIPGLALLYAERLSRDLFTGVATPITPSVRARRAEKTHAGANYLEQARLAGCEKEVTVSAYCEARTRFALVGAAAGALLGAPFSTTLSVLLAIAGGVFGITLPRRAVQEARKKRAASAERHLSEMLEVLALGLRSGLTFDRSFALYGNHFSCDFAQSCAKAHRSWSLGLTTREKALRDLASSYDCDQLSRIVDAIVRSLRFGSALTDILEETAAQSRATYRAALEERVAKAPVKMMLPTGTLILPAMLLLVMGPILLELAGGF